jgi:general secretion pathway protein D
MNKMRHILVFLCLLLGFTASFAADTLPPIAPQDQQLWNLQDADIISVIDAVSKETGKNFVVDPKVQGKITLISSKPIKPENVYQVFLSILESLGYSAIPSGNVIKIVPNIESAEVGGRVATNLAPGKGDEVVVRVIPLDHVSAIQLLPTLRPLLPQWSNISVYVPGNTLIITGRAANLERIMDIIRHVDQVSNDIDVVSLKQASASQITNVLNNLQNASRAAGETPSVFVTPDERTNSILLSGNKAARYRMRLLISQLDAPTNNAQANTEVIYLRYLQAPKLAPILGQISKNLLEKSGTSKDGETTTVSSQNNKPTTIKTLETQTNIQAEPNTNALIITAPPFLMRELRSIISKLDIRPAQVLVEGIIVEINQDDLKTLGIQWGSVTPQGNVNTATTTTPPPSQIAFPPLGAPGVVGIIPNQPIQAILNILENKTSVNILATPVIVVLDNQVAILKVGQDIPEQSGSYATTGLTSTVTPFNTINRKQVTLTFKVKPQINLGEAVRLRLDLTNDSLQNPEIQNNLNPIINTSQISNSVIINSGDILVLGGLTRNNILASHQKIPILGDIPIIGVLFNNKDRKLEKKNLMVFVKPIILHDATDACVITNSKYDAVRSTQINWPVELSEPGKQKQQNILPPWKNNIALPQPF